jgi:hypothetical protein
MLFPRLTALGILLIGLAGCDTGNVKTAADYNPPSPPPIAHPNYDPYTPYGQVNATWQPPVVNREGTIVKPVEPASEWDRPDYEAAPWASGAQPSPYGGPPGTF